MNVINTLKASELAIAERTAGLSIATLEDPNFPKVDLLAALAWVYAKREKPSLTFDEFKEAHSLDEIVAILGINDSDADEGN